MTTDVVVLPGGLVVLCSPRIRQVTRNALGRAVLAERANGISAPPYLQAFMDVLDQSLEPTSAPEVAELPDVAELASLLAPELIGVTEAAGMLHKTTRNVRDLCRRGVFSSAQRVGGEWRVERDEVAERASRAA